MGRRSFYNPSIIDAPMHGPESKAVPSSADARPPVVFIGLGDAGNPGNLKRGFDLIGVRSVFVNMFPNVCSYKEPPLTHGLLRIARAIADRRVRTSVRDLPIRVLWMILQGLIQVAMLVWALGRFDSFILSSGTTFLPWLLDLPLLRLLGKRVIHVFVGSDSFPCYLNLEDSTLSPSRPRVALRRLVRLARKQKRSIRWIERFANVCTDYPSYAHLHEKPFVHCSFLGLPIFTGNEHTERAGNDLVRVFHGPSNPAYKGSSRIREAIRSVKAKGVPIQYVELSGVPNERILAELPSCDFVIDQAYFDAPMAVFAAEAATFGKPAIVAGYASKEFSRVVPSSLIPPTYYCHPDQLESAIEEMALNRDLRRSIGLAARKFIEEHWHPAMVARNYARLLRGTIPEAWWFDPRRIRYVPISGVSVAEARTSLRSFIELGGRNSLQLADKPELEQLMVDFSHGGSNYR